MSEYIPSESDGAIGNCNENAINDRNPNDIGNINLDDEENLPFNHRIDINDDNTDSDVDELDTADYESFTDEVTHFYLANILNRVVENDSESELGNTSEDDIDDGGDADDDDEIKIDGDDDDDGDDDTYGNTSNVLNVSAEDGTINGNNISNIDGTVITRNLNARRIQQLKNLKKKNNINTNKQNKSNHNYRQRTNINIEELTKTLSVSENVNNAEIEEERQQQQQQQQQMILQQYQQTQYQLSQHQHHQLTSIAEISDDVLYDDEEHTFTSYDTEDTDDYTDEDFNDILTYHHIKTNVSDDVVACNIQKLTNLINSDISDEELCLKVGKLLRTKSNSPTILTDNASGAAIKLEIDTMSDNITKSNNDNLMNISTFDDFTLVDNNEKVKTSKFLKGNYSIENILKYAIPGTWLYNKIVNSSPVLATKILLSNLTVNDLQFAYMDPLAENASNPYKQAQYVKL